MDAAGRKQEEGEGWETKSGGGSGREERKYEDGREGAWEPNAAECGQVTKERGSGGSRRGNKGMDAVDKKGSRGMVNGGKEAWSIIFSHASELNNLNNRQLSRKPSRCSVSRYVHTRQLNTPVAIHELPALPYDFWQTENVSVTLWPWNSVLPTWDI